LPFPVFVLAYSINGVGMALQDAQANGFVATLKDNAEAKMGLLHAVYGTVCHVLPVMCLLSDLDFQVLVLFHLHSLLHSLPDFIDGLFITYVLSQLHAPTPHS
jgi:fucose permease